MRQQSGLDPILECFEYNKRLDFEKGQLPSLKSTFSDSNVAIFGTPALLTHSTETAINLIIWA